MQPNLEGIISTLIETKAWTGGHERSRGTSRKKKVLGPWHLPNLALPQFAGIRHGPPRNAGSTDKDIHCKMLRGSVKTTQS